MADEARHDEESISDRTVFSLIMEARREQALPLGEKSFDQFAARAAQSNVPANFGQALGHTIDEILPRGMYNLSDGEDTAWVSSELARRLFQREFPPDIARYITTYCHAVALTKNWIEQTKEFTQLKGEIDKALAQLSAVGVEIRDIGDLPKLLSQLSLPEDQRSKVEEWIDKTAKMDSLLDSLKREAAILYGEMLLTRQEGAVQRRAGIGAVVEVIKKPSGQDLGSQLDQAEQYVEEYFSNPKNRTRISLLAIPPRK